jgi:hypothetical protein
MGQLRRRDACQQRENSVKRQARISIINIASNAATKQDEADRAAPETSILHSVIDNLSSCIYFGVTTQNEAVWGGYGGFPL